MTNLNAMFAKHMHTLLLMGFDWSGSFMSFHMKGHMDMSINWIRLHPL